MKDHYRLSDAEFAGLMAADVTVADLYKSVSVFHAQEAPVSMLSLLLYIDSFGGHWVDGTITRKSDQIAAAVFECLPISDKIQVAEYAEGHENGEW